jgi:hypothetical protein
MPDVMMCPDTVEEFMESYKVTDVEHVYSNGVEFVPIYRMRQWFQHQPERKKGKWLFPYGDKKYKRCSVCERDYYSIPHNSNFCPNCGADMRGEGHETD